MLGDESYAKEPRVVQRIFQKFVCWYARVGAERRVKGVVGLYTHTLMGDELSWVGETLFKVQTEKCEIDETGYSNGRHTEGKRPERLILVACDWTSR